MHRADGGVVGGGEAFILGKVGVDDVRGGRVDGAAEGFDLSSLEDVSTGPAVVIVLLCRLH